MKTVVVRPLKIKKAVATHLLRWETLVSPLIFLLSCFFAAFHTFTEHMTDSENFRGKNFAAGLDVYTKRLQQQITSVQSLLFVLAPLLVIWWQGLQFLGGETWAPHWSPVSLHNNPFWEHTTPCGHFVIDTESHLWGIRQDYWQVCLSFISSLEYVLLTQACSRW